MSVTLKTHNGLLLLIVTWIDDHMHFLSTYVSTSMEWEELHV